MQSFTKRKIFVVLSGKTFCVIEKSGAQTYCLFFQTRCLSFCFSLPMLCAAIASWLQRLQPSPPSVELLALPGEHPTGGSLLLAIGGAAPKFGRYRCISLRVSTTAGHVMQPCQTATLL